MLRYKDGVEAMHIFLPSAAKCGTIFLVSEIHRRGCS
jgi:hypothetical protein